MFGIHPLVCLPLIPHITHIVAVTERKCFQVAAAPITDLRFYEDKFLIALQKSAANGHIYNIKDGVLLSTFSALSLFISPFTPLVSLVNVSVVNRLIENRFV